MSKGSVERCYWIIGRNIQAARKARGYTQDDLATLLRCTRNSVARIEIGQQRIMLHTIPKIARWLGCKPGRLTKGMWTR